MRAQQSIKVESTATASTRQSLPRGEEKNRSSSTRRPRLKSRAKPVQRFRAQLSSPSGLDPEYLYRKLLGIERPAENQGLVLGGTEYRMHRGIVRRNSIYSPAQDQTRSSFGYLWSRLQYHRAAERFQVAWYDQKFPGCRDRLAEWLSPGAVVLDAGCGAGWSAMAFFNERLRDIQYVGIDISDSVDLAAKNFRAKRFPGVFMQDDLTQLPFGEACFDFIFSPGVLHHTDDVAHSLSRLARHLKPSGRFLFWVYHRQPPLRAFTDRHIREYLSGLSNEQAYKDLMPLTKLGKSLARLSNVEIVVPEDVPLLGIPAGRYDVHRFFYNFAFKCFYNSSLGFDRSNVQNFDWFRPTNAHTHTSEEIQAYCQTAGLCVEQVWTSMSGISVIATMG